MTRRATGWILAGLLVLASALPVQAQRKKKPDEPDKVTVQHILIAFKRSMPRKTLERTKKEAQALAMELLERAEAGDDFDALVQEYTDDSYPGVYVMANYGVPDKAREYERDGMVPYFGDVAFKLEVGEVGLAKYHAGMSPYGWHIIKRIE